MKLTERQRREISKIITGELNRVNGIRRLFEAGPDMWRVDQDIATTAVEEEAMEIGMDWARRETSSLMNRVHTMIAKNVTAAGVGGPQPHPHSMGAGDVEEYLDIFVEDEQELKDAFIHAMGVAIADYAVQLAQIIADDVSNG